MPKNWSFLPFSNAFKQISIISKIKLKEYKTEGKFPIIDQGENFISGYWNNDDDAIKEIPLIAFGDHTRRFKFISFPFVAGADGLKLFSPLFTTPCFSYYMCLALSFPNKGYARHSSFLKKCIFPVPPLAEQGRIVAKIEELFAGIDAGVENLKSVKNQIALYRQSVLKSAFDGTLYKTTEWNFTSIGTVCDINPKTVLPDFSDDSIVSFLPMPTVEAETGAFSPETVEYKKVKKGYTKFQNNDVLFAKITPCMENGKSCVVHDLIQGVGFGSTEFHVLRCHAGMLPEYVFYFVVQKAFRSKAISFMTGAVGQKRVPADYLRDCEIPVPTLAEQEKIVAEIESRFERADALETAVDRALNDAEKLKQAVLKKAFSGELVPQNPDDEPASVLLDRIRAARASELPAKKGKRKKTEVDSQL